MMDSALVRPPSISMGSVSVEVELAPSLSLDIVTCNELRSIRPLDASIRPVILGL